MLSKIGPNAVQSSEGFTVSIAKRFELHYQDQAGQTLVPIEPMAGGELVISTSTIPEERREVISTRISTALNFLGVGHRFD